MIDRHYHRLDPSFGQDHKTERAGATFPSSYGRAWRVSAAAALPATIQLAEPATTASCSNQRKPKSSMHSGKSGLMMT